jgi:hypothetical protein
LLFTESFIFKPLDESQCIEVMLALPRSRGMKGALRWLEDGYVYPIIPDRTVEVFETWTISRGAR